MVVNVRAMIRPNSTSDMRAVGSRRRSRFQKESSIAGSGLARGGKPLDVDNFSLECVFCALHWAVSHVVSGCNRHRGGRARSVRPQILLAHDAVLIDDEGHDARDVVSRGPCHQRKAFRVPRRQDLELIAVKG